MDARINPYAPGAGTPPPSLTGRDEQIEAYEVLLDRLKNGTAGQSMVITGLRGVGKTVLLNKFETIATERNWIAIAREFEEASSFPDKIARTAERILTELKPTKKLADQIRVALSTLGSFTVKDPLGFEFRYSPGAQASEDVLGEDFTEILLAIGQAAQARGRGVAFLFDEVQFVQPHDFGPFVVGLHRLNQKALPVTCVAAGLPSLPALVGNAKSYAERLFEYLRIEQLSEADASSALAEPALHLQVTWEKPALAYVFAQTAGYPYFLQEYGKYIWNVASESKITEQDARNGGRLAQDHLDDGFFFVRFERRATKAERKFLHAMAQCPGPPYATSAIAQVLGKRDLRALSVHREALIKKGLIHAPEHGTVDYTVPRFAEYLHRRSGLEHHGNAAH